MVLWTGLHGFFTLILSPYSRKRLSLCIWGKIRSDMIKSRQDISNYVLHYHRNQITIKKMAHRTINSQISTTIKCDANNNSIHFMTSDPNKLYLSVMFGFLSNS